MGYPTKIEWTDGTWNPVGGCSIRSPGCINCYAQDLAGTRLATHPMYAGTTDLVKGHHVFNGKMTLATDDHPLWRWPLKWNGAKHPKLGAGMPSLIFVGDMADLFHENRDQLDIIRVLDVCFESRHISQLLTKRAGRMAAVMQDYPPKPNIWLGFSAERQLEFDERWEYGSHLANLGWTIFVSVEPMIGSVNLPPNFLALRDRAQVICGGESGDERRPTDIAWMRALRDQCVGAGVPYFHKQMTGKSAIPDDLKVRQFPRVAPAAMVRPERHQPTQTSFI